MRPEILTQQTTRSPHSALCLINMIVSYLHFSPYNTACINFTHRVTSVSEADRNSNTYRKSYRHGGVRSGYQQSRYEVQLRPFHRIQRIQVPLPLPRPRLLPTEYYHAVMQPLRGTLLYTSLSVVINHNPCTHIRERLHGHNYTMAVKLTGRDTVEADGYLMDFGDIKKAARALCKSLNE